MKTIELLVAGGGIGGMATALAAAQAGCGVRLYERAPAFSEVGAGIQLGPNATRLLIQWGLQDDLRTLAAFPDGLHVRSARSGDVLGGLPLGTRAVAQYGAPYATLHRADLHHMLHRAVAAHPGVHLNLDEAVQHCTDTGSAVTLRTTRNAQIEGDALIAADGVFSPLRQQLLGDGPPQLTGHLAYRAMLRVSDLPANCLPDCTPNLVTVWLGPRLHLVHYPVRGGQWLNVVAIVHGEPPADATHWDHAANAEALAHALGPVCAPLQALLAAAPAASLNPQTWRLWALARRPPVASAEHMARGLIALLGDAAHPMPPYLAQGAGMAIEDAAELARALRMDAVDMPTRLKRYALARWQRCARVQTRALRNGHIFHATGPIRVGRDTAMRLLGQRLLDIPWLYEHGR